MMILPTGTADHVLKRNVFVNVSAFSLIELILVSVILMLLLALAVPSFHRVYPDLHLEESAEHLAFVMRYAQFQAITQQVPHRLYLRLDLKEYWLEGGLGDQPELFKRLKGRYSDSYQISQNLEIKLKGFNDYIYFYPDGRMQKVEIDLCRKKRCFSISTKQQGGRVHVFKKEKG